MAPGNAVDNPTGTTRPRPLNTLPIRPPGHPAYESAQKLWREAAERDKIEKEKKEREKERVPNPPRQPTPDPDDNLATNEPYKLILEATKNCDVPSLIGLLRRAHVKAMLASNRHHLNVLVVCAAVNHDRNMRALGLLLGLSKGLVFTGSKHSWPWVFRAALLSEIGGRVMQEAIRKHKAQDRNLAKVVSMLIAGVKESVRGSQDAEALVNQTLRITLRYRDAEAERNPLDMVLGAGVPLPLTSALLIRHGADISRRSNRHPRITYLGYLCSPNNDIAQFFPLNPRTRKDPPDPPASMNSHGEERFAAFVAAWWDADWAFSQKTYKLNSVFRRWHHELETAVTKRLPYPQLLLPGRGYFPNPESRGDYLGLDTRLTIVARHIITKFREVGDQASWPP